MTALVARVAGCNEVSLFFPSSSEEAKKLMLATAHVSEINHAYNFGGAQAIAAMAYGTETITKSDKSCCFSSRIIVKATSKYHWLVRYYSNRSSRHPCKSSYDICSIIGLCLKKISIVYYLCYQLFYAE